MKKTLLPEPDRWSRHVAALTAVLRGRGWMTARQITGHEETDWDERTLRNVAAASQGTILSGQAGYKLTVECTPEEVHHATAWLRSQARLMTSRSLKIARTFHQAVGKP